MAKMKAKIRGIVIEKDLRKAVIEVGGIGFLVFAPAETLQELRIGKISNLFTHLSVREDSLTLFGFASRESLDFFNLLITVPGIGPRSALAILNIASPETLRHAISSGETAYLTRVSGIGTKTANKIVLELRDKVGKIKESAENIREEIDAIEALKTLGYSHNDARDILKKLDKKIISSGERVKAALKLLGERK